MLLQAENLRKTFPRGEGELQVLDGVSLQVESQSFVVVQGPSGSGKSTLLQLLGGLDRPSSGSISYEGRAIQELTDQELSVFRRRSLGFVFQSYHLLASLTALENVALPLLLDGCAANRAEDRARTQLGLVGLQDRADHHPSQLSGGEMQRVALARAMVPGPLLLLADEPTGNLDSDSGRLVLELLRAAVDAHGQSVVLVTHDPLAAAYGDRVLQLLDGRLSLECPA